MRLIDLENYNKLLKLNGFKLDDRGAYYKRIGSPEAVIFVHLDKKFFMVLWHNRTFKFKKRLKKQKIWENFKEFKLFLREITFYIEKKQFDRMEEGIICLYNKIFKTETPLFTPLNINKLLSESIIIPDSYVKEIEVALDAIYNSKIKGKNLSIFNTAFLITRKLKRFNIILKFELIKDPDANQKWGVSFGLTDSKKYFPIVININQFIETLPKNTTFYDKFKNQFLRTVGHELIHRFQNIKIDNMDIVIDIGTIHNSNDAKKYLSNKQEIMARAWSVIEFFRLKGIPLNRIKELIKQDTDLKYISDVLEVYLKFFGKDSKEVKLLYKYMYLYLMEK